MRFSTSITTFLVPRYATRLPLSTSVRNDSDGEANQTLTYSYEKSKVGTWNNTAGVTLGVSTTFSAGIPFVISAEFEVSVSASYSHEWGGEVGETETISSPTTVTVPPQEKAQATIIIRNAQIDVGFTRTLTPGTLMSSLTIQRTELVVFMTSRRLEY